MKRAKIPLEVKRTCCEMLYGGYDKKTIYEGYFVGATNSSQSYDSFVRSLNRWIEKKFADPKMLEYGTFEGFTCHDATVQVSRDGEIVQAWIKQTVNELDVEKFMKAIHEGVEPYQFTPREIQNGDRMLEIPLFDMHWGVCYMDYYKPVLDDILELIQSKHWDEIIIPFGQDFFHNDSVVNGQTTKGTNIQKVDMIKAVKEAQQFTYAIIESAIENSNRTRVLYTPGNHDQSISWMFMQVLLERYGDSIVDDAMEFRKVFTYGSNSIMVTHGSAKRATAKNLAHVFPVSFPTEFANSNVREVHCGHLHHEEEGDIFGIMVRRLSSGVETDEWSDSEDFIGAHKRFMLFEWSKEKLKTIHYI